MKNRKTVIVAFLLVAALMIGVGYAAVTNVLDIQGSVSVSAQDAENQFNEDIYFAGVVQGENLVQSVDANANQGYTANINVNNNDKAQFTVTGIHKQNDAVSITYRIKNDSAHTASVSMKTKTNTNEDHFALDYYFGTENTESNKTASIAASGTVDVTVVVTLEDQLTAASSASFIIELNMTAG